MALTGKQILGPARTAAGTHHFRAIDPSTGKQLPTSFTNATSSEVDQACQLAESAYVTYNALENDQRAEFLDSCAEQMLELGDELIERTMAETGLPAQRVIGERGRTIGQLQLFASVVREGSYVDARIDSPIPDRTPLPKPDIRSLRVGIGPVAIFGASNFPLAFSVAGGDTASALAAGCPVVVKAHPAHPGTCELVGSAIQRAIAAHGLPDGVFSLIQDAGVESGRGLVEHPCIKAVGFTGSLEGGRALMDLAARRPRPIPVFAEMGSVNPIFVLPDALKQRAETFAQGWIDSATLGSGQFCTKPGLVFAPQGDNFDALVKAAADAIEAKSPVTMLHAGIKDAYEAGVETALQHAAVSLASSSHTDTANEACTAIPRLMTTRARTVLDHPQLLEEIFGPCTLLAACDSQEEMLAAATALDGQLTASIHGTEAELETNRQLIQVLSQRAGRLIVNGFPTGVEVCPSMHHGGPYPATTDARFTSVGTAAIQRFLRPTCFQDFPQAALPPALRDANPQGIWRLVNGIRTQDAAP